MAQALSTYRIFWWRDRQAPHASEYSVIRSCPGRPDETVSTHPTIAEAKAAVQALEDANHG